MELFEELNVDGTYHKVQNFFDNRFPVIKRKSGVWGDYSSPAISGMPKAPSPQNGSEKKMLNHSYYASAYYAVIYAIKGCSHDSQIVIKNRYLQNLPNGDVKSLLNISGNGPFMDKVKLACCEFADCIEPACDYYHVDNDLIPNLHCYLKKQ